MKHGGAASMVRKAIPVLAAGISIWLARKSRRSLGQRLHLRQLRRGAGGVAISAERNGGTSVAVWGGLSAFMVVSTPRLV